MPNINQIPLLTTATSNTYFVVTDNQITKRYNFSSLPSSLKGYCGSFGYTGSTGNTGAMGATGYSGSGGGVWPIVASWNSPTVSVPQVLYINGSSVTTFLMPVLSSY